MAAGRLVAGMVVTALILSACGSRRDAVETSGDHVRQAVERRADGSPTSTVVTTSTTTVPPRMEPAEFSVWTGRAVTADDETPELSPETIALIYSHNGPILFVADDVSQGDVLIMQTACHLLSDTAGPTEVDYVHRSFEDWFARELIDAGAPTEYIDAWSPSGMLDDLVALGCRPGSTSPTTEDLG